MAHLTQTWPSGGNKESTATLEELQRSTALGNVKYSRYSRKLIDTKNMSHVGYKSALGKSSSKR